MISFKQWFIILRKYLEKDKKNSYDMKIIGKSMFPTFLEGEIVKVKYKDISTIMVNDILVYSHSFTNFTIHRVIEKREIDEKIIFVTKGDNNLLIDDYVIGIDNILGVVELNE